MLVNFPVLMQKFTRKAAAKRREIVQQKQSQRFPHQRVIMSVHKNENPRRLRFWWNRQFSNARDFFFVLIHFLKKD